MQSINNRASDITFIESIGSDYLNQQDNIRVLKENRIFEQYQKYRIE